MLKIIVFTVLIYVNCDKSVIQTILLSRHCDRTPFSEFGIPMFKVDINKYLNQSIGKLTLLGERECFELGKSLRSRYLDKSSPYFIFEINPIFQSFDYKLISTSYDRTIRSGYCVAMGLFPPKAGHSLDIPPYDFPLPFGEQSVPYHSTDLNFDVMLLGFDALRCPQIQKNRDAFFDSKEGEKIISDHRESIRRILEATGLNISNPYPHDPDLLSSDKNAFKNMYFIWDYLIALKQHHLLPDSFNRNYFNLTDRVTNIAYLLQFKKSIVKKMASGLFLSKVLGDFDYFLKRSRSSSSSSSVVRTPKLSRFTSHSPRFPFGDDWDEEGDGSNPKFIHYSGHDQTISATISNLGLLEKEESLQHEVKYGSCLIFELWGEKSGREFKDLSVRIVFKDGYNDEIYRSYELPLKTKGGERCGSLDCPYNTFKNILNDECTTTMEDFCSDCGVDSNSGNNVCLKVNYDHLSNEYHSEIKELASYKGWLMAVSILCSVFYVCNICLFIPLCLACASSQRKNISNIKIGKGGDYGVAGGGGTHSKGRLYEPSSFVGEEEELLSDTGGGDDLVDSLLSSSLKDDPGSILGSGSSPYQRDHDEVPSDSERSINFESADII